MKDLSETWINFPRRTVKNSAGSPNTLNFKKIPAVAAMDESTEQSIRIRFTTMKAPEQANI